MPARSILMRPSAWTPIVMSVAALGLVISFVVTHGVATRQADEGAAARVFELLLVAQLPIVAWFVARWVRVAPRIGLTIIAAQVTAAASAVALVLILEAG